jgi:hypothetical protein
VTITTNSAAFLVQEAARNNQSRWPAIRAMTTKRSTTTPRIQSYRGLSQYQLIDGTGGWRLCCTDQQYGRSSTGAVVTAAFEATEIPEPASLASGLLGLMLIAGRRRR